MKKIITIVAVAMVAMCAPMEASAQAWLDALKGAATTAIDKATGGKATELMLPGTWNYASPALKLVSDNALADAAASALVTGVEQKLEKAYTAIGIKPGACSYTFNTDNTFTAVLGKRKLSGTYTYDAATHAIELKYTSTLLNLGSMKGYAYLDGNSMELVFDCSKLMTFLTKLGSKVSMLSGITKLVENYDGMMIGFGFTK